jgi:cell division protein ZapA (FtsZ GTPase activity inhibitor)
MSSRELSYRIVLATSDAKRQARNIRSTFEKELQEIRLGNLDTSGIKNATAQVRQLRQEVEQVGSVSPTGGGVGGFFGGQIDDAVSQLKGLAAGYLGVQGVISGINEAIDLTRLNTQAERANKSFDILSGGAERASVNVMAIQTAAGGAVTSLSAIAIGNQAASLGLAKTTQGFEDLARSARLITMVSPIIREQGEALTQLALFSSNAASYARADQLGLSATEVRNRIKELRVENGNLDDSQLKLMASMQLLDEKFGALLNTTEAQASGLEKLTTNYQELRIAVAGSTGPIDAAARALASGFSQATTYVAGTDTPLQTLINNLRETEKVSRTISQLNPLKDLVPESVLGVKVDSDKIAQDLITGIGKGLDRAGGFSYFIPESVLGGLDPGTILGDPDKIKQVVTALELASNAVSAGVPGAEEYFNSISAIAVEVDKQNYATSEQIALVSQLTAAYQQSAQAGGEAYAQQTQAAEAAKKAEEARLALIFDQQEALNQALATRAQKAAPSVGIEAAINLYREQKLAAETAIDELAATGVSDVNEIAIRTAGIVDQLIAPFDALEQKAATLDIGQYATNFVEASFALDGFDQPFVDALPSLQAMQNELVMLSNEMSVTGAITAEQAAELDYLGSAASVVSSTTSQLTAVVSSLGIEFLLANDSAAATVDAMYQAEIAYINGQIGAGEYAGILSILSQSLLTVAGDAGIATGAIQALNAAQAGKANLAGLTAGEGIINRIQLQEGVRQRETGRREQERAARETERAFGRAARSTEKAFTDTARQLQSDLRSVPGLFKRSSVTQEQIDLGNMGIAQTFADDFLRQAEDEFKNGVDWPNVDLADVARRVGLDPSLPAEQIFNSLVEQWESGALFADKANLELINKEAVDKALELQEKARQGQQNILEFFGAQVESAVAAITGGGGGGGGSAPQISIDTSGAEAAAQQAALALTPTIDLAGIQAQLDTLTVKPLATLFDSATIQAQLDTLKAPALTTTLAIDTSGVQTQLDAITAPKIEAKISLDAENIITINGLIAALTPKIQPVLDISAEALQLFATGLETNMPAVAIHPNIFADSTKISEFYLDLVENLPSAAVQTHLAITVEEIEKFKTLIDAAVHPTVQVALALPEQQMNADGSQGANAITPLLQSINTQTRASTDGIMREGASVAQILIAGMIAHMKGGQGGEQAATPLADALMTNASAQFMATQNMFYAVGFGPAASVESGFISYGYSGLSDGLLESLTNGIRADADAYMQRGATIAGYVQKGIGDGFSSDIGIRSALTAGGTWGNAFMQGALNAINAAGFVDQITTAVVDGITDQVEQP